MIPHRTHMRMVIHSPFLLLLELRSTCSARNRVYDTLNHSLPHAMNLSLVSKNTVNIAASAVFPNHYPEE
jgi:hypothetical protein